MFEHHASPDHKPRWIAIMADDEPTSEYEIWKMLPGREDRYEVSNLGRVRSRDMSYDRRGKGKVHRKGRILRQSASAGYMYVKLCHGGHQRREGVAALVCEAFEGPRPAGFHAGHRDGGTKNNARVNLQWLSPVENEEDKRSHGTFLFGERHPQAKLNADQVRDIRRRAIEGESEHSLARAFGISRGAISSIKRGKTWRHVD